MLTIILVKCSVKVNCYYQTSSTLSFHGGSEGDWAELVEELQSPLSRASSLSLLKQTKRTLLDPPTPPPCLVPNVLTPFSSTPKLLLPSLPFSSETPNPKAVKQTGRLPG